MINKEMIRRGIKNETIKFIVDPNMEYGTVAKIGEYWFYFSDLPAAEENPEVFLKNADPEEIVNDVFDALNDMIKEEPASPEYRYYEACLREDPDIHWAEVRCKDMDEYTRFWNVDAWDTGDDAEEGKVVAMIDDLTGRVIYLDPLARSNRMVQEVINDFLANWKPDVWVSRNEFNHHISLHIRTAAGEMIAEAEPNSEDGNGYDAIFTGLQASEEPNVYMDLVAAKADESGVRLYTFNNPWDENYTPRYIISKDEIVEVIRSEIE